MSSNFTRNSKDADAAAKDSGIRAIPGLKFLRYVRNAKWVVGGRIFRTRARASLVFARGENTVRRAKREISSPEREREREILR